jgi:pyruvate/2-oxoglutarate dehydrogenase complex dihydrolipoamide dehydrogenase (E3) component
MSRYDLIVLGAGATGLAAARAARKAGRSVALVDKAEPGGDCTHYGCVPSKTLLDLAHRVAGARAGQQWGLGPVAGVDFAKVMAHVHQVIDTISADESPAQLAAEGIELLRGWARLTSPTTLDVEGRTLEGSRLVLATGATAAIPPIDGLSEVPHLDNRTLFDLTEQPEHLLVLGGGAIGVELAQAFSQLGSRVTLVEALPRILTKEEPEASAVMTTVLERSGVDVRTGSAVQRVSAGPTLHLADGSSVRGSHLFVCVGRTPATAGIGLDEVGITLGPRKEVVTDEYLRTSVPGVFAAGDCTTGAAVHARRGRAGTAGCGQRLRAGHGAARWLGGMTRFDDRVVPWVTFTDPEVGRVGLTEQQAYEAYGDRARVAVVTLDEMDRPRTSGHADGYLKLIAGPRPLARHQALDQVVGLTAVMPSGGEVAATAAVAMQTGMLAGRLAQTIAPYPTYALGLRLAAGRLFGEFGGATWRPARGGG